MATIACCGAHSSNTSKKQRSISLTLAVPRRPRRDTSAATRIECRLAKSVRIAPPSLAPRDTVLSFFTHKRGDAFVLGSRALRRGIGCLLRQLATRDVRFRVREPCVKSWERAVDAQHDLERRGCFRVIPLVEMQQRAFVQRDGVAAPEASGPTIRAVQGGVSAGAQRMRRRREEEICRRADQRSCAKAAQLSD